MSKSFFDHLRILLHACWNTCILLSLPPCSTLPIDLMPSCCKLCESSLVALMIPSLLHFPQCLETAVILAQMICMPPKSHQNLLEILPTLACLLKLLYSLRKCKKRRHSRIRADICCHVKLLLLLWNWISGHGSGCGFLLWFLLLLLESSSVHRQ